MDVVHAVFNIHAFLRNTAVVGLFIAVVDTLTVPIVHNCFVSFLLFASLRWLAGLLF